MIVPGILSFIGTLRGALVGGAAMLAVGLLVGEIHGRHVTNIKWKARVSDVQAEVLALKASAAAHSARRIDETEKDKATMRKGDTAILEAYRALQTRSDRDRSTIRQLLQEANNDPSKFNCARVPMPSGLQRHPPGSGGSNIPGD